MTDTGFLQRCKNLMNMIERGYLGERKSSEQLLARIMKKNGISLDDLQDNRVEVRWDSFRSRVEIRRAITQEGSSI